MEQRFLGRSGLAVSRLALGTWTWGQETPIDDARAQLVAFLDAGGTLVDTADVYARGESERVLGRLLRDIPRTDVIVATKADGLIDPTYRNHDASRRHLLSALEASLERLELDHVDLWQLHAWDPDTPLEESLAALDTAVTSGRARYVGVSNYSGWQAAKAATWQHSWPTRAPLVSIQSEYSLLARGVEAEVLSAAADAGMGFLAWSPLGRGVLTGKYRGRIPADSRAVSPPQVRVRTSLPRGPLEPNRRGCLGSRQCSWRRPCRRRPCLGARPAGRHRTNCRRPDGRSTGDIAQVRAIDSA